jgi:hypothetical protein
MPDTIVPIVRRPIRRPSTDAVAVKPADVVSDIRKLSIGGESNSTTTSTVADSPLRYRKTISSLNKERERAEATSSATTSRRSSLFDDSELKKLPAPIISQYEVPANTTGFPHAPKDNVPKLHETRNKAKKTPRDIELEQKVLQWIISIVHEKPTTDYDHFLQDGSILAKVMTSIVFNSVPLEQIDDNWGTHPAMDRVKSVIREIKRYGVVDVFEPMDLIDLRNVPKVTKCLAQLSKLAASDKDNLIHHN